MLLAVKHLLYTTYYVRCFIHMPHLIFMPQQYYLNIIIPILQMSRLRLCECQQLIQRHTGSKWRSQDSNLYLFDF